MKPCIVHDPDPLCYLHDPLIPDEDKHQTLCHCHDLCITADDDDTDWERER